MPLPAPKVRIVDCHGEPCEVRALSFADFVEVIRENGGTVAALFDRYATVDGSELTEAEQRESGFQLLMAVPSLLNAFIATAVGEPEKADVAARLPIGDAMAIAEAAWDLTFAGKSAVDIFQLFMSAIAPLTAYHSGVRH